MTDRATPPFTREQTRAACDTLKLLGHPHRLRIICALADGERGVGELELVLAIPQPALSQQLATLREAGLIQPRRVVKQVFYRLADARTAALVAAIRNLFAGPAALLDIQAGSTTAGTPATPAEPPGSEAPGLARPPGADSATPIPRTPEAARFARVAAPADPPEP